MTDKTKLAHHLDELLRALTIIKVVGQVQGHDVVLRASVIDIASRRLDWAKGLEAARESAPVALPLLPDDESIVHIYPWDLERMESAETTATAFSVAVGCPDGESVALYTAEQMHAYAKAAIDAIRT